MSSANLPYSTAHTIMYRANRTLLAQYHSKVALCKSKSLPIEPAFNPENNDHYQNFVSYITDELFDSYPPDVQDTLLNAQGRLACTFVLRTQDAGLVKGNIELKPDTLRKSGRHLEQEIVTTQEALRLTNTYDADTAMAVHFDNKVDEKKHMKESEVLHNKEKGRSISEDLLPANEDSMTEAKKAAFVKENGSRETRWTITQELARVYGTLDEEKLDAHFQVLNSDVFTKEDWTTDEPAYFEHLSSIKDKSQLIENKRQPCKVWMEVLAMLSPDRTYADAVLNKRPGPKCKHCTFAAYKDGLCFNHCTNK